MAFLSLCLVFFAVSGVRAESQNPTSFDPEREMLRSELKLAAKPDLYLIVDLNAMKVTLKAKAVVLREFAIIKMKYWGDPVTIKPHVLVDTSTFFKPTRETITPEDEKATIDTTTVKPKNDKIDIKALELDDMPENYKLFLDENITLYVNSDSHDIVSNIYNAGDTIVWHVVRPIETILNRIKKKNETVIRLTMDSQDARALYWALKAGINILIMSSTPGDPSIDTKPAVPSG